MLTRNDRILIIFLVIIGIIIFISSSAVKNDGGTAVVEIESQPVKRIVLAGHKEVYLDKVGMRVEVEDGRIRVRECSCLHKICVTTGWIHKPGQVIVCMPKKVVIRIEGKSRTDAVSY